jgi:hypothetical protein
MEMWGRGACGSVLGMGAGEMDVGKNRSHFGVKVDPKISFNDYLI